MVTQKIVCCGLRWNGKDTVLKYLSYPDLETHYIVKGLVKDQHQIGLVYNCEITEKGIVIDKGSAQLYEGDGHNLFLWNAEQIDYMRQRKIKALRANIPKELSLPKLKQLWQKSSYLEKRAISGYIEDYLEN